MREEVAERSKPKKVDAYPVTRNPLIGNGKSVLDWGTLDWSQWIQLADSGLDIPYGDTLEALNEVTRVQAITILEQFHEGVAVVEELLTDFRTRDGKKAKSRPTVYLATDKSMEKWASGGKASVSFVDGELFMNYEHVLRDASRYLSSENAEKFFNFGAKTAQGEWVPQYHAGFAGHYLLMGVEMTANHYFQELYGSLKGAKPLDKSNSLAEFDSQPSSMFGLLLQVDVATKYLDRYFVEVSARRSSRRKKVIEYPNINDTTIEGLLHRISVGWKMLPDTFKKEFSELRDEVESRYQESLQTRNFTPETTE